MRIYDSVLEAVKETERDLFEMGIDNHAPSVQDLDVKSNPDYDSKELLGYGYVVTKFLDIDDIFDFFFQNPIEKQGVMDYVNQELKDRFSPFPLNPGRSWYHRKEYWERFLHNGLFSYTYSERVCHQIPLIISELRTHPESRQCVITVFRSLDLSQMGGKSRIPCSMYYHFLRRKISGRDVLLLNYTMRSCDYYTHFPIDVWLAIQMGKKIAESIGCKLYSFTHFMGSLHAFRKDFGKRRIF